jgi:hypothetical protein
MVLSKSPKRHMPAMHQNHIKRSRLKPIQHPQINASNIKRTFVTNSISISGSTSANAAAIMMEGKRRIKWIRKKPARVIIASLRGVNLSLCKILQKIFHPHTLITRRTIIAMLSRGEGRSPEIFLESIKNLEAAGEIKKNQHAQKSPLLSLSMKARNLFSKPLILMPHA